MQIYLNTKQNQLEEGESIKIALSMIVQVVITNRRAKAKTKGVKRQL